MTRSIKRPESNVTNHDGNRNNNFKASSEHSFLLDLSNGKLRVNGLGLLAFVAVVVTIAFVILQPGILAQLLA